MTSDISRVVAATIQSAGSISIWQNAVEHTARLALNWGFAFLLVSKLELNEFESVWVSPLAVMLLSMLTSLAAHVSLSEQTNFTLAEVKDAAERAVRSGLAVAASLVAFDLIWPIFDVRSWDGALSITLIAALITFIVGVVAGAILQGKNIVAMEELSLKAEEAVLGVEGGGTSRDESGNSSISAADFDAQLAYRYRVARRDAENMVRNYLPANPRIAKRMVNHASLALAIAKQRGLFEKRRVTEAHLGKWVGISVQWSGVAAALTTKPDRIVELEDCVDLTVLQEALDRLAPGSIASAELQRRLSESPTLRDVLHSLIRYEIDER
jgi:hypothetical protein